MLLAATAFSLCAFWMNDVACSWLMRTMSGNDPLMVSLVQLALQLPVTLVLLPAGALADIVDRVRLLVFAQLWMLVVTTAMWVAFENELLTPHLLLFALVLLGTGSALRMPNVGALIPDLVPTRRLTSAISLSTAAINGSRLVGPVLAGIALSVGGVEAVFGVNVLLLGLATLAMSRVPPQGGSGVKLDSRAFLESLKDGLRQGLSAPAQRQQLLLTAMYTGCAGVATALMTVRFESASIYAIMYAAYGAGAFFAAIGMSLLKSRDPLSSALPIGMLAGAVSILGLSQTAAPLVAGPLLFLAGAAWVVVITSIQISAALSLSPKSRGRGLALLYAFAIGGMALASPVWGAIAKWATVEWSLGLAGATMLVLFGLRKRLFVSCSLG
jgi:hypothetical protein